MVRARGDGGEMNTGMDVPPENPTLVWRTSVSPDKTHLPPAHEEDLMTKTDSAGNPDDPLRRDHLRAARRRSVGRIAWWRGSPAAYKEPGTTADTLIAPEVG